MTRDSGLQEAIGAVGGVGALARSLGLSQPSVSNWERTPAERVLAVEAATGVSRARLRPDLYPDEAPVLPARDDVDEARAQEYQLLAHLLFKAPDAGLLQKLTALKGDASPLGLAHIALADAAGAITPEALQREFFHLFIGLGRGEILPYASYYLTGFLHDRPLARVRQDFAKLGIEQADDRSEPEDHIATLCEVMAAFASGELRDEDGKAERAFFERHLKPWAVRLFAEIEMSESARFYKPVGLIGRLFMEIEAEAFTLPR